MLQVMTPLAVIRYQLPASATLEAASRPQSGPRRAEGTGKLQGTVNPEVPRCVALVGGVYGVSEAAKTRMT